MQNKKKEKVAVVTGAGGTLCSEMARELANQGIKVALIGRTLEKLQKVESQIKNKGGTAISVSADVADEESVKNAHELINRELGPVSILINGAGGNQFPAIDNPEHTHPLSGIKSRIQKESIFPLNPDLCQISTKRSNNM